jgi:hypothetical protein
MTLRRSPWATEDDLEMDWETGLCNAIVRVRARILEERETDRIIFCGHHQLDPATFTGCHGCRGAGYHWQNGLPCWCAHGAMQLRYIERREDEETLRLIGVMRGSRTAA